MWYVYFLQSQRADWNYVGHTSNLRIRFRSHNSGENRATAPYTPFTLIAYIAVQTEEQAVQLERYFKTGAGAAWRNKHLFR